MTSGAREDLEIRVTDVQQIFHTMDPSPFHERDLDPAAEAYIVGWARELPASRALGLHVRLRRGEPGAALTATVRESIAAHFRRVAGSKRRELRLLLRNGWISLLIGFAFVGVAVLVGEYVVGRFARPTYGTFVLDSTVILAWVALWRPMEILLYDWWPILGDARLYERLAQMEVGVAAVPAGGPR